MDGDRRAGFMLLEVLVAAVVAVVLLSMLTRLAGDNWHRVEEVRGTSGAMAVARSVLEESSSRDDLQASERSGMAGVYRWVVRIERLSDVMPAAPISGADQEGDAAASEARRPVWALHRLDVVVIAPGGRRSSLESFRLGRIKS